MYFLRPLLIGLILISCSIPSFAQNGSTVIPMPGFFSSPLLRNKNCLAIDAGDRVWVGFRDIGVCIWDGSIWTYFDNMNSGLPENNIKSITFDTASQTWIGTASTGLVRYDGVNWFPYTTANSSLPSDTINAVVTNNGDVWIATNAGLARLSGSTWTVWNTGNSALPTDSINTLCFAQNGDVWIGTQRGAVQLSNNVMTTYAFGGNPYSKVRAIYAHDDGSVWASDAITEWKMVNATFVKVSSLYSSFVLTTLPCKTISKGPHGGVIFPTGKGQINEFIDGFVYTYYPPGVMTNASNPVVVGLCHPSDSTYWFINTSSSGSPFIDLIRLDGATYTGFGRGLTYANTRELDVNEVRTPMLNRGDMHWDLANGLYEVPKGSGSIPLFCTGFWIGGLDSMGDLHQSAMTYRQRGMDYAPGPIDPQTGATDSATANHFDRIWRVDRYAISEFIWQYGQGNVQNGSYLPQPDFLDWPAIGNYGVTEPLAPFVDVDNNGVYNPLTGGDYPKIKGDQMLFWVYNDLLISHTETFGQPLHVQINASAWAFACPTIADSDKVLNYTTYYQLDYINRSSGDYNHVWTGIFQDVDLGNWQDDYLGSFPEKNFGFAYNGDANDDINASSVKGYGLHPPMFATTVIEGPRAVANDTIDNNNDGQIDESGETCLMTSFRTFVNNNADSITGNPNVPSDYYNYLQGLWRDGVPMTVGGNGYGGTIPQRCLFPGYPNDTAGWNEFTVGNVPFDRRYLIGSGPANFAMNDTIRMTYGLVFSRDTTLTWNTNQVYDKLISDVDKVRNWHLQNNTPSCFTLFDAIEERPAALNIIRVFPNPANDLLTIAFQPKEEATVQVYDSRGALIARQSMNAAGTTVLDVSAWPTGIYFIEVLEAGQLYLGKVIKE